MIEDTIAIEMQGFPSGPSIHREVAADGRIGYYGDNDYSAIDATRWVGSPERPFAPVGTTGTMHAAYNPLYNGNIAHTVNSLQPFGGWVTPVQPAQVLAQVYKYDQLNRLKQAQGVTGLTAANTWDGITDPVADRYKSKYTYDANGNIETVKRFDDAGTQYDNLEYHYEKTGTDLLRNRLYHLNESINGGYGDIGIDASPFHGAHADVNLLNNYQYDALGNLIADKREEIANIEWTVSGKVKHITRTTGSSKPELWFTYGPDGQRTSKTVGDPLNGGYKEYYLRDASGNIMATYRYTNNGSASLKVTDRPIYGSSRIGSYTRQMEMVGSTPPQYYPYIQPMQAPLKRYELTDHLGNVNMVVTGRLLPGNGAGSPKQAEVVSAQTHEAYGSLLPNRNWDSDKYAWGYNSQLKNDEVYGVTGTSYTAKFWQYDARAVHRWNLDPVFKPWQSGYSAFSNNPIARIDPNGDDDYFNAQGQYIGSDNRKTRTIMVANAKGIYTELKNYAFNKDNAHVLAEIGCYYAQYSSTDPTSLGGGMFSVATRYDVGANLPAWKSLYNDDTVAEMQDIMNYSPKKDRISFVLNDGFVPELLNDGNNMISAIEHEGSHKRNPGHSVDNHLKVYLDEVSSESWKSTTEDYKAGTIDMIKSKINRMTHYTGGETQKDNDRVNSKGRNWQKEFEKAGISFEQKEGE